MNDQDTIVYLNRTIDKLLNRNSELQMKLDSVTELVDFYVEHYESKGYKGTSARFKDLQEDVERTIR